MADVLPGLARGPYRAPRLNLINLHIIPGGITIDDPRIPDKNQIQSSGKLTTSKVENHLRINQILLGSLERPALKWLAAHMPARVTPDHLTTIGTLGALVIFASYWACLYNPAFLWLASFGFVINWFGDSLDGSLARYRHIERPKYGFFVDHCVDAINETIIFLGLGFSPYMRLDIAAIALSGYLLMSILVYVRTCVDGEFRLSYGGLGPTEVRLIAILSNTIIFFTANPSFLTPLGIFSLYDLIGIAIALLLFSIFIVSTINQSRQLSNVDQSNLDQKQASRTPSDHLADSPTSIPD